MAIYLGNLKVNATAGTTESGGSETTVEALNVTSNGIYSAPTGTAYSPVTVSVPTLSASAITLTENGVYSAPTGYAYSPVTVSVSGGGSGDYLDVRAALTSYSSTASSIPAYAFACMSSLTAVSLPNITSVPLGAFMSCSKLTTINAPGIKFIYSSAFYQCSKLFSVDITSCHTLSANTFYSCSSLSKIDLPHLYRHIGSQAFCGCRELHTVKIGSSVTSTSTSQVIWPMAFNSCYNLLSLYLYNSTMWKLSSANVFNSTPISTYTTSTGGVPGSIFVPASLVNTYKSATNWAKYSARITSIPA